jgi:hypothetical protein
MSAPVNGKSPCNIGKTQIQTQEADLGGQVKDFMSAPVNGKSPSYQGETQMQTQEADGWSFTMFINPKRGRQENGRVQAKRQNQIRVQ